MDLTSHPFGITVLTLFGLAYVLVICEEFTQLRKSIPVILAASLIWALIAIVYADQAALTEVESAVSHFLNEFAKLFLFLLVAMTYVNAMTERQVFERLRDGLLRRGFSYRALFWITGLMSFFLSPLIDNLTTALVMCAVVLSIGKGQPRFVSIACVNIVIAANAGGAFSPFGDITTLMVWQRGVVDFWTFFALFVPAVLNYVIPAVIMSLFVPEGSGQPGLTENTLKRGARRICLLFLITIACGVSFQNFLGLPPFLGMLVGLALLQLFGFYLHATHQKTLDHETSDDNVGDITPFDAFRETSRIEWDTLLFFLGVILCVGGLGFIGYLEVISHLLYDELGATAANVLIGALSSLIDNIPIMVAVLEMSPDMDLQQWLLITLTAGVGGSLLSIGSAAGVALMGQARGAYSFFSHLRWTPVILLGYLASIGAHLWLNSRYAGVLVGG